MLETHHTIDGDTHTVVIIKEASNRRQEFFFRCKNHIAAIVLKDAFQDVVGADYNDTDFYRRGEK